VDLTLLLQSILAGLTNGFVYGLVGLGMSVIFRGSRVVNAMQGDFAVIAGMAAVLLVESWHWPLAAAMAAAVLLGAAFGWLIEITLVRAMRKRGGNEDSFLLLTLGVAFAVSALVLYTIGRDSRLLPGIGGEGTLAVFDAAIRVHALWLMLLVLVLLAGLRLFYTRTQFGLSMTAAAIDADGAATMGINVARSRTATFALGGFIGGLAGVLVTPLTTVNYEMGLLITLKGFAAAILGGLGNAFGAIAGGLTLGLLESLAVVFISSGYKDVIALGILILIMIFLPHGLAGRAGRKGG
jgi:branched-chain amino acid transport system permease protein